MMQERFQNLLKEAMGLDANSIGISALMRAVESRSRMCGMVDLEQYWECLQQDVSELQALVEVVAVPETWFFRDREAFTTISGLIRSTWLERPERPQVRILSLPCSTGEEPYTIAMSVIDLRVPPQMVHIEGIDISNRSLDIARKGVYGRNSFRGADLAYRDRHFTQTAAGYQISEDVRSAVHFSQGNIFELDSFADGSFDVIFCRNLLIYFDPVDQRRATQVLHRLLAPRGTLFVGHSEASVVLSEGFASLRIPQAFAFQKIQSIAQKPNVSPVKRPIWNGFDASLNSKGFKKPKLPTLRVQPPSSPMEVVKQSASLEDIQRAADRGELDLALQLGDELLRIGPPQPEVLYLLAVISEAAGAMAAAADFYRRTLYLDPDHHEALTHLALMQRRMGDSDGASRNGDRARRVDARKGNR